MRVGEQLRRPYSCCLSLGLGLGKTEDAAMILQSHRVETGLEVAVSLRLDVYN